MWHGDGKITGGLIILVVGLVFLLRNLGIITQPVWSIMWPLILVVIGIGTFIEGMRVRMRRKKE